jgi:hypothetical protein
MEIWMKSCGVFDWQKVPKEGTVGHHEALRMLLFFSYFCFCVILLFVGDELCFSFFMILTTLDVDRSRILHCFGHDDLWRTNATV